MSVLYTNNAKTTLSASLNNSATSLSVASSSGFPSLSGSHYFYATLDDNTNLEVVKVTAVSGTTWTVVRGQDNTSATAFSSGDTVELRLNAALLTDVVNDALASSFTRQDFTGNGSTTAFTLNKTPGSENDLIVFIEGVFQNQADYTLSGTTLTFDEAPASSRKIVVYHVSASVSGDSLALNTFSGDGSTTAFTMSVDPLYENNTMVFIDGVYQNKSTYSTSGTTLTFDAAPANGTAIDVTTHTQATVNVPVDGSVSTAKLAADAVTGAKIADDAIDSEHYTDGSIDTAHIGNLQVTTAKLAADAVTAAKLADDAVVTANITDDAVTTAKVADDQITLAKLAGLARGKIIYGDASGNPAALALGSAGTVLTSDGTDISWAEEVAVNYLPLAGGTMTGTIAGFTSTGIDDNADATAITIDSSENVAIGRTSNIAHPLDIQRADNAYIRISSGTTQENAGIIFANQNSTKWTLEKEGSAHSLFLKDASSTAVTFAQGGNVGIGGTPQTTVGILDIIGQSNNFNTSPMLTFKTTSTNAANRNWSIGAIDINYGDFHIGCGDSNSDFFDGSAHSKFTINKDGNVGIGTTSPDTTLEVKHNDGAGNRQGLVGDGATTGSALWTNWTTGNSYLDFRLGGTSSTYTKVRITSGGNLLLGGTADIDSSHIAIHHATGKNGISFQAPNTSAHMALQFYNSSGGRVGYIQYSNTATTFSTSSDYRLKENITPIENGLDRLNNLNPVKFDWKDTGVSSEGFIAHEAQEVFPDAVTGEKDGEDMQGMDYGRITPLLVKAIQEQQTIIEDLKARIETLEG